MLARAQGCDVGLPKPRVDEGKSLMGGSGLRTRPDRVVTVMKARITIQGRPTQVSPDSVSSSQRRARTWCGESWSIA